MLEQEPALARFTGYRHIPALLLILVVAALRCWYLLDNCPLDLAPDEAHYWDWSRHPDWSYYSKGPLVAYLIQASTFAFSAHDGSARAVFAVRFPAVVCGALMLLAVYLLTVQVYRSVRMGLLLTAVMTIVPLASAGSLLMTIDAPYCCCWSWALLLGYQAVFRKSSWAWPLTGLVLALGILAKYTMILWFPAFGLFLLTSPESRRLLVRPGFWVMTGLAGCGGLPILIWNLQHDWVTFRHVGGQAGVVDSPGLRWHGPFIFVGVQFGLLLGFWFVPWLMGMIAHRPTRETNPELRYLWWLSAFVFLFFLAFSIKTEEQPNWPAVTYISGSVLSCGWCVRQFQSPNRMWRTLHWTGCVIAAIVTLTTTVMMHHSEWIHSPLSILSGPPTQNRPMPMRRFDPTCRLRGWRTLAEEVDAVRSELRAEGHEPILAGSSWNLPGELGFYCSGQPTVYSLGTALGDRRSQYDFWRPNPVWDEKEFLGKTVIFVGDPSPPLEAAFERVEARRVVEHRENGRLLARWSIVVCRGYCGFSANGEKIAVKY